MLRVVHQYTCWNLVACVYPGGKSLPLPTRSTCQFQKARFRCTVQRHHTLQNMANREQRIKAVRDKIGAIPDFPKPGILFRDIFPLFKEAALLNDLILLLVEHIKERYEKVDVIVGLEARGFLFGPMIAQHLNAAFVPIRKKGKLPGECVKVEYSLEYGTDVFEAQKNAVQPGEKVLIVDDLIATGGTMDAACKLIGGMGGDILECLVVIELVDLKGAMKLKKPFFALVQFEGE